MLEEKDIQQIEDRVTDKILKALKPMFVAINDQFTEINLRFDNLERVISSILLRLDALEKDVAEIKYNQKIMRQDINDIKEELARLREVSTEDIDANCEEIVDLRRRVSFL